MAWFKVDDAFHSSKPVMRIPRRNRAAAVGLWTLAGTWSSQEETDGFIPEYLLEELCGTPALAGILVRVGLWEHVTGESQETYSERNANVNVTYRDPVEPGWQFRKWSDYNPLKSELEEKRESERIRKANYRKSQQRPDNVPAGHPEGHQAESSPPDPTRPDPTLKERVNAPPTGQSGTTLPSDFRVTAEMTAWALSNCPNIDALRSTTKFKEHYRSVAGRQQFKTDWFAAWRLWLLNDQDRAKPPTTPSTGTSAWDRKGVHGYEEGEPT